MSSAYGITARYYDPMASLQQGSLDARFLAELETVDPGGHPVLDIGAGTGLSTVLIARALPGAEIVAVEPDPAMRAALMARVWSSPVLRQRVTILPSRLAAASLPPRIAAAVGSACLVHFDPRERERLWALLAERLAPAGPALFDLQCPIAQDRSETSMGTAQVGRMRYEGWVSCARVDDDRVRFRMRYVSRLGDEKIEEDVTEHVCWAASVERVLAEAARAGLRGREQGGLVVLRRAS